MIGGRIRETLRNKKLSQAWLARKIGVTPMAVSHWATGNAEPDLSTIAKIAEALGVTKAALIGDEPQVAPTHPPNVIPLHGLSDCESRLVSALRSMPQPDLACEILMRALEKEREYQESRPGHPYRKKKAG